jgi:hypothetical protein
MDVLQQAIVDVMYAKYAVSAKQKALRTLQALVKTLSSMSDTQRDLYTLEYQRQLTRLQGALLESDVNTKKRIPEFISFHDRIFRTIVKIPQHTHLDVPSVFAEFVRGITYFAGQEDIKARPIYHRLYSCGERGDEMYKALHQCSEDQTPEQRRIAEERIYTCFLERMIFDDIYKHCTLFFPHIGTETHSQDEGHVRRLEMTQEDFKTCFPDIDIKINIDYLRTVPRALTIIKKVRGKPRFVEVYTKDDNDDFVKCVITKSSGVYLRINTSNGAGRIVKIKGEEAFATLPEAFEHSSAVSII